MNPENENEEQTADFRTDRSELFLRLLNEHERNLSIYVHSLIPDWAAAQDVLQETRVTLWKEFSKFERGTNFAAWARTVAFYQILTHRKKVKRSPLPLSDEFLHSISDAIKEDPEKWDKRSEALRHCVAKLPLPHRRLIALRYFEERSVESISEKVGRTVAAIYRALSRIRRSLEECVTAATAPNRS